MSEEEREQDVWISGNRGETRREPPSSCAGSVRGPARRPVGLGQSEQGEESGNQLTAGLGAAELALGAIHPSSDREVTHPRVALQRGTLAGVSPNAPKVETGRAVGRLLLRSVETRRSPPPGCWLWRC